MTIPLGQVKDSIRDRLIIIRRNGALIELSGTNFGPLDHAISMHLAQQLQYDRVKLLHGTDRISIEGTTRNAEVEIRKMFRYDDYGHLVTGFGFMNRIVDEAKRLGVQVGYVDVSPPRANPNAYVIDEENMLRHVTPKPKQWECLRQIDVNEVGSVKAATAFGKTFLFEALVHRYPNAVFAIVIPIVDVAEKVLARLSASMPNVGMIGGGYLQQGERVTIFTVDSLHRLDWPIDFLLVDEIHLCMTDSRTPKIGEAALNARSFCFSACPDGRMDGASQEIESVFGKKIFDLPYKEAVALGMICPIRVRWLPIRMTTDPAAGKVGTPRSRWGIWRNEIRNRTIANDVRTRNGEPDKQVLILTDKVDHTVHLWQHLPEFALCFGEREAKEIETYKKNRLLPANFIEVTKKYRNEMRERFECGDLKKVIATDVWATGVDFTPLQFLYRADARESPLLDEQAPGRPARLHDGKDYGEVIDCYDGWNKHFRNKSNTRRRHYKEIGYEQIQPDESSQLRLLI